MRYVRKTKPAPWVTAFPDQVSPRKERVKWVRRRSDSMEAKMVIYRRERAIYLVDKMCVVFPDLPATDVHHRRGRWGPLLLDKRYWSPVSRQGHDWIDAHREEARQKGWLAKRGEWGKSEP